MASVIELRYNPFIPRMNILIDGQQPSEYSQLIQYADEDIFKWSFCIFESIYSEIRDDYVMVFTGTDSDAELLRVSARNEAHCKGFKHVCFAIDVPVNQRMIALQKFIVSNAVEQYKVNRIGYRLLTETGIDVDENLIKSKMNITNRFCIISEANETCSVVYDFIIASSVQSGRAMMFAAGSSGYTFIITLGEQDELIDIDERAACYSATKQTLLQTIFKCWVCFPLTIALRDTYNSIREKSAAVELQLAVAVDPVVKVSLACEVELGGTSKLIVNTYPENLPSPKLIYKIQNKNIATCNGIYVSGKAVGQTKLEIYKTGESIPVELVDISVIRRNRIKELFLSEEQLLLGKGDDATLLVSYSPRDADNVSTIRWESTDDSVMKIGNGRIHAVGTGCCRIICTAENVSAQCICTVKEYLQDIRVEPAFENNIIALTPMGELELSLTNIPPDTIDGELYIYSTDYDVVNHVGKKLLAKNPGNAEIQIFNSSKTVIKTFVVTVSSRKRQCGFIKKIKQFLGLEE